MIMEAHTDGDGRKRGTTNECMSWDKWMLFIQKRKLVGMLLFKPRVSH